MRRIFIASLAVLTATTFLAEAVAARDGGRRPRIVIYPNPRFAPEPGTIYGYAPGIYVPGRNGVLYGPYPLNPSAAIAGLRY